jgi:PIN domain nuclease of toxin-antitoxin system
LEDEANELFLSVASVWEMQIKIQLGKLKLSLPLKELVKNQQEPNNLTVSPVALTLFWHWTPYLFITKIRSIGC